MPKKLSQALPLLLLAACFSSHSVSIPNNAPQDAGTDAPSSDTAVVLDASLPRPDVGPDGSSDAGPDASDAFDAGMGCPPVRADFLCGEGPIAPNRPSVIEVGFYGTLCCGSHVQVRKDDRTQTLFFYGTHCDLVGCHCAPRAFTAHAVEIPPLAAGTWQVQVNDQPAFPLEVGDGPRAAWCTTPAVQEQREICEGNPFAAEDAPIRELCVSRHEGRLVFEYVSTEQLGCTRQRGPCIVEPSIPTFGNTLLHLRSQAYEATCEEGCALDDDLRRYRCLSPTIPLTELPIGVLVQGALALEFSWSDLDDEPVCASLPE